MKQPLWRPSAERIANANMTGLMQTVNSRYNLECKSYDDLWRWSVDNRAEFWETIWQETGIISSQDYEAVLVDGDKMPGAKWFVGARLNFAENLLRYRDDREALVFKGEDEPEVKRITYAELYDQVARLAKSLREAGV